MEFIRKAVERTRSAGPANAAPHAPAKSVLPSGGAIKQLDPVYLEANRVIAHDISDARTSAFDMLRTQVLQAMDQKAWRLLAVTSPTAGCGKTLVAANLALSIARLPERPVLLLELDLRKPQLGKTLGLETKSGIIGLLGGSIAMRNSIMVMGVGRYTLAAILAEQPVSNASEWIASRAMGALLQLIRREFPSHVVILDTPPMLAADDFLMLQPQVDCVLLVGAVGTSTMSDIEQCKRHLISANVVRVVLNKVRETSRPYYGAPV